MNDAVSQRLYRTMVLIRDFETTCARLFRDGRTTGGVHLSLGQEAVAAGVCDVLRDDDTITTTHRGHGHCLAKGADPRRMFAELLGHADGYCKGKAGSMHLADPAKGILGATAIVGGGLPLAVGAAFSAHVRGADSVSVAFFGEGAVAEGSFHESLNLASLWRLPAVFVCENNQYAELTHVSLHLAGRAHRLAQAHDMPGVLVDGNDVAAVRAAATDAVARARAGEGPTLLECETYRWSGHYEGDRELYRSSDEVAAWRSRDPIARLREQLEGDAATIDAAVAAALEEALAAASAGEPTPVAALLEDVYTRPVA